MFLHKATVTPKVNFFVKSKTEKKDLSKTLRYIFIFFQIVFALDNGFIQTNKPRKKLLIKLVSFIHFFLISGVTCYGAIIKFEHVELYIFSLALIYFTVALVLLFREYSYLNFLNDLYTFDREIYAEHLSCRLELKIVASITLLLFYMVHKYILKFFELKDEIKFFADMMFHISFVISKVGTDFVRIIYFLVFSSVSWRINKFIQFVKRDKADIVACQYLYKHIADITEKAKANFDVVFMLSLIYNSVSITLQLFIPFADGTFKTESGAKLSGDILSILNNLILMLAPSVTAGLLSAEVEKLVLTLRDKVLLAKDEKKRVDIRRFVGYIEARPLKFTVCGVVPLDWNLPVIVVNMSFTYLIVMIQFTHKY